MVSVGKPLITSQYTGTEFKSASALNAGVCIENLNESLARPAQKSIIRRKKSQAKVRKSMKF